MAVPKVGGGLTEMLCFCTGDGTVMENVVDRKETLIDTNADQYSFDRETPEQSELPEEELDVTDSEKKPGIIESIFSRIAKKVRSKQPPDR
jgi:hypothetical protein